MTIAFAVAAFIAVVAIVALVLSHRAAADTLAFERERSAQLVGEAEQSIREALAEAEASEERFLRAYDRAQVLDLRASQAADQAAEAEARAAAARQQAMQVSPAVVAIWDLERLRLEREWSETAGPFEPMPVQWDGSIAGLIGVELAIIRESMGTPSRLELEGSPQPADPAQAVAAAGLARELLRAVARVAEEMTVTVTGGPDAAVTILALGVASPPEMTRFEAVAQAAGATLRQATTERAARIRLGLPSPARQGVT